MFPQWHEVVIALLIRGVSLLTLELASLCSLRHLKFNLGVVYSQIPSIPALFCVMDLLDSLQHRRTALLTEKKNARELQLFLSKLRSLNSELKDSVTS